MVWRIKREVCFLFANGRIFADLENSLAYFDEILNMKHKKNIET